MRNIILLCLVAVAAASGCKSHPGHMGAKLPHHLPPPPPDMPRELSKVVLPTYTVEPPDILVIEAIHIVPRSPYHLRTSDLVAISVQGTLPDAPIAGAFPIQPGGMVALGVPYGSVKIAGLTIEEAQEAVRAALATQLRDPVVSVSLLEMSGKQQIAGTHLVGPDGTVTLGSYGSVPVVGLTLAETKQAIEIYLTQFLEDPEVSVDVFAYNSKSYYIITEGAGMGDGVSKWPITGNETVLDAVSNINGLTQLSSKRIWIARPVPYSHDVQLLPVDWQEVTAYGGAQTNYQLMPGDRLFVAEDSLVAFDTKLAKLLAPLERAMGFSLLGAGTATRFSGKVLQGGGNPQGGGGGGGF
jgi:polysaccharide export outer membrane protein